ncbi:MAG: (Fe-S)-binding protein, partial [Planctomycetota bacterium]
PQFGGTFEVQSHVPFLLALLREGRLTLDGGGGPRRIAYYDSCYLGRYRGLYDEPRELLARLNEGSAPLEADRNRERSFCCGAGGGRMWMEETLGSRINLARYDQYAACNAEVFATACPFCLTMFDDAVKDRGQEEKVKALDIAEILAARLPAPKEKESGGEGDSDSAGPAA